MARRAGGSRTALSHGPRLPVPYQACPAAQLLLRARTRPRRLLCNQKRSCCLDISIFISFIDFIFMSFREHFLWLLTSFCCPCPLARLGEKERQVRKGVRGSVPCAPFSSLMPPRLLPDPPPARSFPEAPCGPKVPALRAHTPRPDPPSPAPTSPQACGSRACSGEAPVAGEEQPRQAPFPSAVSTDLGETWLSPLPRRGSPASKRISVTVTLLCAGDS